VIYADQLRDAARVAAKAAVPVTIEVAANGFRVIGGRAGGLSSRMIVPFEHLEMCNVNPLVEAVRTLVARLG